MAGETSKKSAKVARKAGHTAPARRQSLSLTTTKKDEEESEGMPLASATAIT